MTAFLAIGKVEGWATVSALVEFSVQLSLFLDGFDPMEDLERFPNVTGVLRELLPASLRSAEEKNLYHE